MHLKLFLEGLVTESSPPYSSDEVEEEDATLILALVDRAFLSCCTVSSFMIISAPEMNHIIHFDDAKAFHFQLANLIAASSQIRSLFQL